ncbi:MAG: acyl-CoA dehydrogenase family protein [Deltaproteobacteria bacterium]|nr:acyl-CoA dehydrogenase family protein [Deltaproteobacteria bacterium]
MNFTIPDELESLRQRVHAFMHDEVLPAEGDVIAEDREGRRDTLVVLRQKARAAGLWTPHLPRDLGGLDLGVMGMCVLFREMGRSLVGPSAFNCDAPDQGNMDLLLHQASEPIRERWLRPLCAGDITSAFCMTEPAPGAGADPRNLRTTARLDGDTWVIDGHKWYSTGGDAASFLIVMARTSDDPRHGATLFIVDRDAPGVEHLREVETMSEPLLAHREAELRFEGVRVGADAVLGSVGQGFQLAQARLVPARLTHCMRWLGLADRALDLCKGYLSRRISFGKPLGRHQAVQEMVARGAMAIHAGNLMTFHCAWMLAQGRHAEARTFSSMCKLHNARMLCQVLDDAIQMHGSLGFSRDMPFGDWYRFARSARIADGPDEVHMMVVARDYLERETALLGP